MIENKNNTPTNTNPSPWFGPDKQSDLKKNETEIKSNPEVLTIHTMKDDLESLKNPSIQKEPEKPEKMPEFKPSPTPVQKNIPSALPEKKDKPFLSQANWDGNKAEFEKDKMFLKEEVHKKNSSAGKVFFWIIIVFVIIAAGAGSYYFWTTKIKTQTPSAQNIPATPPESPVAVPTFATDKANYLSLDFNALDNVSLKDSLKTYASKVLDSKITTPLEFVITDSQNNPVSFQDFSQKLGISLPPGISSLLADKFSLFIYNDNGKTRLGLAIASTDGTRLKLALLSEEKNLTHDLEPIYLASSYTLNVFPFSMSTYKNYSIRFTNITSPEDLSVDYTLRDNQLVLGTTKMTLRTTLDYLDNQTPQAVPAE